MADEPISDADQISADLKRLYLGEPDGCRASYVQAWGRVEARISADAEVIAKARAYVAAAKEPDGEIDAAFYELDAALESRP